MDDARFVSIIEDISNLSAGLNEFVVSGAYNDLDIEQLAMITTFLVDLHTVVEILGDHLKQRVAGVLGDQTR